MPSAIKKDEDIIKNYYYINIEYVINILNEIIKSKEIYDYNILIKNCVCNLKDINDKIDRNNIYLVDEYIFGIFANIYITNDIIRFYNKLSLDKKIKKDKSINCTGNKYDLTIDNNKIAKLLYNNFDSYNVFNIFLKTLYDTTYKEDGNFMIILLEKYIRNIIIPEFNKAIYKDKSDNILYIESLHFSKKENIFQYIDFTHTYDEDIIKSPFDHFNKFINYKNVLNNKSKTKSKTKSKSILRCLRTLSDDSSSSDSDFIIKDCNDFILNKDIINFIKYLILFSISTNTNIDKLDNKYISINQYGPICWFICILTSICFSDLHKKIISSQELPDNNYSNYIKEIVNNISKCGIKHNDIKKCSNNIYKLLYSFQNKPTELLELSIIDYIDKYKENIDTYISSTSIVDFDYYAMLVANSFGYINENYFNNEFKTINELILNKEAYEQFNNYLKENTFLSNIGIYDTQYNSVFKYIYNKLGFNITYLEIKKDYNNNIKYIYKINTIDDEDKTTLPNPEDILILKNYNSNKLPKESKDKIIEFPANDHIISAENNNIKYKGIEYKLDYILLQNNTTFNYSDVGHLLSAIKIDNEKYIYDGSINIYKYRENYKTLPLTCSFMKYDWNENIFNNSSSCIIHNYLCDIILSQNNNINRLRHLPHSIRDCFDNSKNIYVYIKTSLL